MIEVKHFTDLGVERATNEDNFIFIRSELDGEEIVIAIICDGMGGLDNGEYASREVCETVKQAIVGKDHTSIEEIRRAVTVAIKRANRTIFKEKTKYGRRCGTTVTGVLLADKGYVWHVGDSRVIQIRQDDVRILTNDHTRVGRLLREGRITQQQSYTHPDRNKLEKAVGVGADVKIDMFQFDYRNSTLVLATDGFWHGITRNDFIRISERTTSLGRLFDKVVDLGETDNVTAMTLYC